MMIRLYWLFFSGQYLFNAIDRQNGSDGCRFYVANGIPFCFPTFQPCILNLLSSLRYKSRLVILVNLITRHRPNINAPRLYVTVVEKM